MDEFWKGLRDRVFPGRKKSELEKKWPVQYHEPPRPEPPLPAVQRRAQGYPESCEVARLDAESVTQGELFDPALRQFVRAFRMGDPAFADPEVARKWYAARGAVMTHVLRVMSASPCGEPLVLRGSLLLRAWLGEAAREPGDMDWVVTPPSLAMVEPEGQTLVSDLLRALGDAASVGEIRLLVDEAAVEEIWTYERAPGRRIVIPWEAPGASRGTVQMDLVYGEELWGETVLTSFAVPDGNPIQVRAATPALSLAWKLLWLETDAYAQGKDLYDAVLLAERTYLPLELLQDVLEAGDYFDYAPTDWKRLFATRLDVDWENFIKEYPWIRGSEEEWKERLITALAPTFATPGSEG